jgi:hypothetical protein
MMIFSAETRVKENAHPPGDGCAGVKRNLPAEQEFLPLLTVSAGIAIPLTWYFYKGRIDECQV